MPDRPAAKSRPRGNRVTSYDVARLAKVSQPTVSRAFTPGASITKDKRDRVLAAAKKLRYVPNLVASNLSTARTNTVAVIIGDMNNPFYSECLQTFIQALQARDRQVLAFSVPEGGDPDDALMQAMRYHTDGIIVTSALLSSEYVSLGATLEIPIVMFNRVIEDSSLPSVLCNNFDGSHQLAKRMLAAGARRFLVVRGTPQGSTSRQRVEGFCSALDEFGIARKEVVEIDGGSSYAGAFDATMAHLTGTSGKRPDAVFAVNDIMAIGCADAIRDGLGLRIPDDVMLAGFDGIRDARYAGYDLTTVRQPIDDMVREALDLVQLDDTPTGQVVLNGVLVPGSTVPGT